MYTPSYHLDPDALDTIHHHTLQVLRKTGVQFPSPLALDLFKHHGFRTRGNTVFFEAEHIRAALGQVPDTFTVAARNPDNALTIGGNNYVMTAGYGPPFIMERSGRQREATRKDARCFYKLVQSSPVLDFNSSLVVQPNDVSPETAHLDLLQAALTLTDKVVMGSSVSRQAAEDSLEIAKLVFGGLERPVMLALVNNLSPLKFAPEMVDNLMRYAESGQPLIIHSAATLGASGPITAAGSLVVSNATNLAGICLAQLVLPGTPLVYGLGGSPIDMRSGNYINAGPENVRHVALAAEMGRYYRIPCRGQGALTESFCLDYQAGMESAMMLTAAALSGVHVGLHACGTMGSLLAMSFEKFLVDEDLCGALKSIKQPLEITEDAFAMDLIGELGHKADYLMQPHTVSRCRSEFFVPELSIRALHANWLQMSPRDIAERAHVRLAERLGSYVQPPMDEGLARALGEFIKARKAA